MYVCGIQGKKQAALGKKGCGVNVGPVVNGGGTMNEGCKFEIDALRQYVVRRGNEKTWRRRSDIDKTKTQNNDSSDHSTFRILFQTKYVVVVKFCETARGSLTELRTYDKYQSSSFSTMLTSVRIGIVPPTNIKARCE